MPTMSEAMVITTSISMSVTPRAEIYWLFQLTMSAFKPSPPG